MEGGNKTGKCDRPAVFVIFHYYNLSVVIG